LSRTEILQAIGIKGIPSLSILPGVKAKIGFDVSYIFNSKIPLSQIIHQNGSIDAEIIVQASTSPIAAEATSDFSSTLKLLSIDLPNDFTALDPEQLQVVFDSGDIYSVTRGASIPPDPEPIPTPALLPGLIGFMFKVMRHRKISQNFAA
jgi:hypothetical protein